MSFPFPLLLDQNLPDATLDDLHRKGEDVRSLAQEGLSGADDQPILERAFQTGRVVVTQDRDFGRLALAEGQPLIGVVYLRPGTLSAHAIVRSLALLVPHLVDIGPPFIAVVDHRSGQPRIRLRQLSTRT